MPEKLDRKEEEEVFDFFYQTEKADEIFNKWYENNETNCDIADYLDDNYDVTVKCLDKADLTDEEWEEIKEYEYMDGAFRAWRFCEKYGINTRCPAERELVHQEDNWEDFRIEVSGGYKDFLDELLDEEAMYNRKVYNSIKEKQPLDDTVDRIFKKLDDKIFEEVLGGFARKYADRYSDEEWIYISEKEKK